MFKVEAWVLLNLFKFLIKIIKMSNMLQEFYKQRRGNGNIQSFRIVGVIRQKLKTMALMVKIDNLVLFKVVKVFFIKMFYDHFSTCSLLAKLGR